VRRASISAFISAAHQKTEVIRPSLDELLPMLYRETVIRPELVHIVDMGPFKHIVDDGLENRKVFEGWLIGRVLIAVWELCWIRATRPLILLLIVRSSCLGSRIRPQRSI
jgi:hypothetical protein